LQLNGDLVRRRALTLFLWNTAGMHMRTLAPATLVIIALAATGCGLLETNDDELETLRVEIIQLREDFMDLEAEVSLLARVPATTTTSASSATATTAAPATTTSKAASSGGSSSDEADDASAATVPVGLNEDAILTADHVIDMGPRAGVHGGEIIAVAKRDTRALKRIAACLPMPKCQFSQHR
jgi:hypothetical protein